MNRNRCPCNLFTRLLLCSLINFLLLFDSVAGLTLYMGMSSSSEGNEVVCADTSLVTYFCLALSMSPRSTQGRRPQDVG
jgi:hypothetical protein